MGILLILIINSLLILLTIAFFTLFERKVIGRFHLRIGPNKVRGLGILQPLLDAFKLFGKENISPNIINFFFFNIIPIKRLILRLLIFTILPNSYIKLINRYSIVFFICLRTLLILCLLFNS